MMSKSTAWRSRSEGGGRKKKPHHQWRSGAREALGGGEAGGALLLAEMVLCQTPPFIITCAASLIRSIKHGRDNSKGVGCIRVSVCVEQQMLINGCETERRSIKHMQSH